MRYPMKLNIFFFKNGGFAIFYHNILQMSIGKILPSPHSFEIFPTFPRISPFYKNILVEICFLLKHLKTYELEIIDSMWKIM